MCDAALVVYDAKEIAIRTLNEIMMFAKTAMRTYFVFSCVFFAFGVIMFFIAASRSCIDLWRHIEKGVKLHPHVTSLHM